MTHVALAAEVLPGLGVRARHKVEADVGRVSDGVAPARRERALEAAVDVLDILRALLRHELRKTSEVKLGGAVAVQLGQRPRDLVQREDAGACVDVRADERALCVGRQRRTSR